MATLGQQTSKIVLHVRPIRAFTYHDENAGKQIDTQLQQVKYPIEVCTNVYRALARLSNASLFDHNAVSSYQAVVVCVDSLGQGELEFFTIMATHARNTPVLVYSNADDTDRLAAAQSAGATGVFDSDTINRLNDDHVVAPINTTPHTPAPMQQDQTHVPLSTSAPEIIHDSPVSPILTLHDDESEEVDEISTPLDDSQEPLAGPIQVPWQTRKEGPVRRPPSQSSDDATARPTDASALPKDDAHAPLLTEDELKALLDEDVASWPPNDWGQPDAANPNSGAELS